MVKIARNRFFITTHNNLWGNTLYCVKLSGEDLSRYSNEIESVGLRKCPHYHYFIKRKWCHSNKRFSELSPLHIMAEKWLAWRNDVTVTLCTRLFACQRHFSERGLTRSRSLYAIARPSICRLSVCLSSVTFVPPTQAVQIFGNISMALGTLAIQWHPLKSSQRSSQGNPSVGGVKHEG